jgi:hypothetical protein
LSNPETTPTQFQPPPRRDRKPPADKADIFAAYSRAFDKAERFTEARLQEKS